ncbi:MAG: family 16 glycosylhydrolase [Paludibacter sp.]|nr:family 16 glycosylhydrolase [Paludibacter sp.]
MKTNIFFFCYLLIAMSVRAQNFIDPETPSGTMPANDNIGSNWALNFSDEFNGSELDLDKWTIDNSTSTRTPRPDIGVDKWFWKPANVVVSNGNLVLKVKKENDSTMHCGSIRSLDKYMPQYGYFEARIQIANVNKGTHTAFWLQGPNMGNVNGNGNDGAEIDIFESAWTGDYTKSVIHIDGYGQDTQANTKQYTTDGIHTGFHTWGMRWTHDYIKIYYDGVLKVTYNTDMWIPRCPEYLWLSDGASFGVQGDSFFVNRPIGWLTEAYVDYMRVWFINSLLNGTFADNGDNWTLSNGDIAFQDNAETNITGKTCRMPGAAAGRNIRQTIGVTPGSTYQFGFKGRIQNAIGASGSQVNNHSTYGVATLKGEILDANNNVLLTISTQSATDQTLSDTFTVPAGVTTVTVKLSKDWNIAYLDDVELLETTPPQSARKHEDETLSTANPNLKDLIVSTENNKIKIEATSQISSLVLFDASGRIIRKLTPGQSIATVDLVSSGIYIIEAKLTGGEIFRKKIAMR